MNLVATSNQETEKVDYGEPIVVWGVATFYRGTEEHPGKRQIWIQGDWQLAGPAQLKHLLQLADAGSTAAARGHQQATSCGAEAFSSWEREILPVGDHQAEKNKAGLGGKRERASTLTLYVTDIYLTAQSLDGTKVNQETSVAYF
jgi:hypothetical protein